MTKITTSTSVSDAQPSAANSDAFLEAIRTRRTIYTLEKSSPISDDKIEAIVKDAIKHVPSSFNSQTTRALVLLHGSHTKLWSTIAHDTLKAIVPADAFSATEQKLNAFSAGYGSVLFFEDDAGVKKMQDMFPKYASNFPSFAEHSNGMAELVVWTAFAKEGLGASLQHYSPLIDAKVKEEWGVPETWQLKSQMVFGRPTTGAGEKVFSSVEDRVLVSGKE